MTTDPRGRRSVILECDGAFWFDVPAPLRGEIVFCPSHRKREKVKHAPAVYRGKCRHCSAGRKYGTMLGLALREISKHIRNKPTHVMDLYDGYVIVETVTGEILELPLTSSSSGVDDPPPY